MAVIAVSVAIDVAGASCLRRLIDKRIAGVHAATRRTGSRVTTRE